MQLSTRLAATALALVIPAAMFAQAGGAMPAQGAGAMPMMKAPPSKQVTVTGTVVDVSCKFGQGLHGPDHKMCAEVCSDRGLPLAVLGDDGKLYIPASPAMPGDPQNNTLKPFAERKVKISGKAFSAGGAQAIQITSIAAAQ